MKFLKFWFPVICYSAIIFVASSLPGSELPWPNIPFLDKVVHLIEYMILGFLFSRALRHTETQLTRKEVVFWTLVFCLLYGASDEFHQWFVPGRMTDIFDLVADGVGGTLGGSFLKHGPDKIFS